MTLPGPAWVWLLRHVRPYWFPVLVFLAGNLASRVLTSLIASATGRAVDAVVGPTFDTRALLYSVAGIAAIVLVRGALDLSTMFSQVNVATGVVRDIRDELHVNLLRKSQTFFHRHQVGDLTARATGDAELVSLMFAPGAEFLFIFIYGTAVPLVFIGVLNFQLLLTPALFILALLFAVRLQSRRLDPVSHASREAFGRMNAHLTEVVAAADLVVASGQRDAELDRFDRNSGAYRDQKVRAAWIQGLYLPPLLLSVALVGALFHALWLVSQRQLSPGGLVAYLALVSLFRQPIEMLGQGIPLIRFGWAGATRVLAILRDDTVLPESPAPRRGRARGAVEFDHVSFAYEGMAALSDISFSVGAGETIAVVGVTGSGKSTLLKLLNRTYDPDAGEIRVDGTAVRDWDLGTLRSGIGVIEQDTTLFSGSVADNIGFGLGRDRGRREAIENAARIASAHEFVTGLPEGYDTRVGEHGVMLSGGQRQRLAIARAVVTDPAIFVMDDSTSAVDGATEEAIQEAMRRVTEDRTTFVITNRLPQIVRADRVLLLDRGRLVDQGAHAELMERCDLYRKMFGLYEVGVREWQSS